MVQVLPSTYFRANFLTVRPNAANDTALESLNKCETFWNVLILPILYGLYGLYRNWADNIPLKSYEKCETFSCRWFSLIPSRFEVIPKTAGLFVLPLLRN